MRNKPDFIPTEIVARETKITISGLTPEIFEIIKSLKLQGASSSTIFKLVRSVITTPGLRVIHE